MRNSFLPATDKQRLATVYHNGIIWSINVRLATPGFFTVILQFIHAKFTEVS